MKITWVLLAQEKSREHLLPLGMLYKICLSTGKKLVPAVREVSPCCPCPAWFYQCVVCFLFRCIDLLLNHHSRLCHSLQQDFSLSKNSVCLLYLPAVISLVHWRVMDMLLVDWLLGEYASGLCHCVSADRWWDMMIWPTIMLFLRAWYTSSFLCWAGKTSTPLHGSKGVSRAWGRSPPLWWIWEPLAGCDW